MVTVVFCGLAISCFGSASLGDKNEIVMSDGMVVNAKNDFGVISIVADGGFYRTYIFDGHKEKIKLRKRDKRWNGSFGIYSPTGSGDIHLVVEEGYQHFYSGKEAIEWLVWQNKQMHYVYTSDGLVVGWSVEEDSESGPISLSVQLWQFYIQGMRPVDLTGSSDDLIIVEYPKGKASKKIEAEGFTPSAPKKINNISFSGKAIDLLKEKKITIDRVTKCLNEGESEIQDEYTFYYDLNSSELLWLMIDQDGRVALLGD